jgi:hypothetical protein
MRWQRDFSRIWLIRSSPGRFCEPGRILAAVTACLLRCRRASPTLRGYMGLRWAPATQGPACGDARFLRGPTENQLSPNRTPRFPESEQQSLQLPHLSTNPPPQI